MRFRATFGYFFLRIGAQDDFNDVLFRGNLKVWGGSWDNWEEASPVPHPTQ